MIPDTGKLKWYFQFTPHDLYDYDAVETPVLVDTEYQGQPRKLIVEANRNGYVYVLDRTNGKFLSATQFVKELNWAKGVDAQRPPDTPLICSPLRRERSFARESKGRPTGIRPRTARLTHLFYFMSLESCSIYFRKPAPFEEGKEYYSTGTKRDPNEKSAQTLLAFDPQTRTFAWRYPQASDSHGYGGVMTTATGLVFFADNQGFFEAVGCEQQENPCGTSTPAKACMPRR